MLNPFSDLPDPPHSDADPLGLEAIDRQIRINELRAQTEAFGMSEGYVSPDMPPEIEEAYLRSVVAYESAPLTTHFTQIEQAGVMLTPPEKLDDVAITNKLWEVIQVLASLGTFLECTNHLSDRELYTQLWQESLRESTPCLPPDSGWVCHMDLIGSGSEEDTDMYLRYYADEQTREQWRRDFPEAEIPPHESPPFDRDRLLPRPG